MVDGPYTITLGAPGLVPQHEVVVADFAEASRAMRAFIEAENLGSRDLGRRTGEVRDAKRRIVARVSYNGRVWEPGPYPQPEILIGEGASEAGPDGWRDYVESLADTPAGRALGAYGFRPDGMGGNLTAFTKLAGDIEVIVYSAELDGQAPERLREPVVVYVTGDGGATELQTRPFRSVTALVDVMRAGETFGT